MTEIETKATAPGDINGLFAEFMGAFEEFKRSNDERLGALEKRGSADVLTEDKLKRLDAVLDGTKAAMDRLALERGRPQLEAGRPQDADEYKDAFAAYVKRGEEKALSIGSNPDGGYLVPSQTETRHMPALSRTCSARGTPIALRASAISEPTTIAPELTMLFAATVRLASPGSTLVVRKA